MELTLSQRLILLNQYELMSLLDNENEAKYRRLQTIIKGGFRLDMEQLNLDFTDVSAQACQTILDTLEMYQALQASYNNLKTKEITAHRVKFLGYCAVQEKKYHSYLKFIKSEGKYNDSLECENGSDSQTPMWSKYQKMLAAWRQCPRQYHLSEVEIRQILDA